MIHTKRRALGRRKTGLGTPSPMGPIVAPRPAMRVTLPVEEGGKMARTATASRLGMTRGARRGASRPHDASATAPADIKLGGGRA